MWRLKFHTLSLHEIRQIADVLYLVKIARASVDCCELLTNTGLCVPVIVLLPIPSSVERVSTVIE